ncbi:MAG: formylglycine-generating enzyme family protein [Candidatus Omnitrophota bacterium]
MKARRRLQIGLALSFGMCGVCFSQVIEPALETITVKIPNLAEEVKPLKMVLIPAGKFTMGSSAEERKSDPKSIAVPDADWPQHEVTITHPFYFGAYEVTQAQWKAVMGTNPASRIGEDIPVNNVSWNDCQKLIEKVNAMGIGKFRLPTEAEWEYACRAGTTTRFFYGDVLETDDLEEYSPIHDLYMWYIGNTVEEESPLPVGLKLPNPWGLYDIHGNVWEWCQDWWGKPWDRGPQVDPIGPKTGTVRVVRGGGALGYAQGCRSADRRCDFCTPDYQVPHIGFRLVREYEEFSCVNNFSLY